MTMDLTAIRVFATLAREGSLTRAVAGMGISGSALSLQLRTLRDELGPVLPGRAQRGMRLTDADRRLLPRRARVPARGRRSAGLHARHAEDPAFADAVCVDAGLGFICRGERRLEPVIDAAMGGTIGVWGRSPVT